jgi:hypothetical protein
MSAFLCSSNGIGFWTTLGGATARASASVARAWRRTPSGGSAPPGSSTTNEVSPLKVVFCHDTAVPW